MLLTTENIILIGALLLLVSVFAGKVAYRFGAPALLLFLGVGMLFGLRIISFNSAPVAQFVGTVALSVILFSGGMDTRYRAIRPVIGPGVVLATVGVALTALIVAGFVYVAAPWCNARMPFLLALLFAATMSSTDSASVFSILRSRRQGLCENLKPLLELESGSNDPMAYILTILLVGLLTPGADVSFGMSFVWFVVGMSVGVVAGYGFGRLAVWSINRLNIANQSLYAVLLLAFVFLTFSVTDMIRGNGYLAVYVAGLVVGNYPLMHKKTLGTFFDGFTWLFQVILFVTLGLLVNIDELLQPEVLLLGGLGGRRVEHTLANLCTGLGLEQRGVRTTLLDERSRITFVMPGETRRYPKEKYFFFSAFPMEGRAQGVCERGSYYELTDAELTASYPLGVSNEYAAGSDCITISTRSGALVVVETIAD